MEERGRAVDYLPYFILAFSELGKQGIGKDRGRFILEKVESLDIKGEVKTIYTCEKEVLHNDYPLMVASELNHAENKGDSSQQELKCDFKTYIEESEKVKNVSNDLQWYDWERYSTRQRQKMTLGGVLGNVKYEGNLKPFTPFLRLGEYIHVGKGTSFGLGQYQIMEVADSEQF